MLKHWRLSPISNKALLDSFCVRLIGFVMIWLIHRSSQRQSVTLMGKPLCPTIAFNAVMVYLAQTCQDSKQQWGEYLVVLSPGRTTPHHPHPTPTIAITPQPQHRPTSAISTQPGHSPTQAINPSFGKHAAQTTRCVLLGLLVVLTFFFFCWITKVPEVVWLKLLLSHCLSFVSVSCTLHVVENNERTELDCQVLAWNGECATVPACNAADGDCPSSTNTEQTVKSSVSPIICVTDWQSGTRTGRSPAESISSSFVHTLCTCNADDILLQNTGTSEICTIFVVQFTEQVTSNWGKQCTKYFTVRDSANLYTSKIDWNSAHSAALFVGRSRSYISFALKFLVRPTILFRGCVIHERFCFRLCVAVLLMLVLW